ncbi:MAG: class D sortase [Oscillospiraceae bacterium]|nr:class D sortase [Oscillospiraceae bacterium]
MKKMKTLISTMLCLCTMCALALPAHALEYNISAPGDPEYGKPTSFEPVVTADGGAMKNEDVSKNAALIPPGFGTPTSYMRNTGEYLTPNLVPSQMAGAGAVNGNMVAVLPSSSGTVSTPTASGTGGYPIVDTSISTSPSTTVGFTDVTSAMYYSNGSLGTLKTPSIGLTVGVYEGTDSAALLKGAGHFEGTSIWMGNVCVAGHNRGVRNDFGKIHTLNPGDIITFTTMLGTRTYAVTGVNKVSVNDTSGLAVSSTNMISLYTCVMNQPAYRWCVTAVETV